MSIVAGRVGPARQHPSERPGCFPTGIGLILFWRGRYTRMYQLEESRAG